jgi:PAS domain-containing protein
MKQVQLKKSIDEPVKSAVMLENLQRVISEVINAIPNPAYFRNTDGVFIGCNPAFTQTILGAIGESIVGRSITDLRIF